MFQVYLILGFTRFKYFIRYFTWFLFILSLALAFLCHLDLFICFYIVLFCLHRINKSSHGFSLSRFYFISLYLFGFQSTKEEKYDNFFLLFEYKCVHLLAGHAMLLFVLILNENKKCENKKKFTSVHHFIFFIFSLETQLYKKWLWKEKNRFFFSSCKHIF